VTATGENKVYDGSTNATVTLSDDRLSGDSLTTSYTQASFADKNVGTSKPVSVTGISFSGSAAGNYQLASTTALTTADITLAPLTVGSDDKTRVYGVSNPTLTVTYTGFVSGENSSVLGGTLSLTTTATSSSPVGSYPITVSGLT